MSACGRDEGGAGPFLVKIFYRTGAFHRPDEFSAPHQPAFVPAHVLPSCTLAQLAHLLAAAREPAVLPRPCVGTRVVFRHLYENPRFGAHEDGGRYDAFSSEQRFIVKNLGSVVLGGGGPGAPLTSLDAVDGYAVPDELVDDGNARRERSDDDGEKTFSDARFMAGDFISCAILPPLANGCVAPASSARSGRGYGIGEAPATRMPPPPSGPGALRFMDSRYSRKGRGGPGSGGPAGEWRRGDALPDDGAWVRDGGRGGGGMGRRDWGRRRDRPDRW